MLQIAMPQFNEMTKCANAIKSQRGVIVHKLASAHRLGACEGRSTEAIYDTSCL